MLASSRGNDMKLAKIFAGVVLGYAAAVAALEVAIWHFQPDMPGAVVITTTDTKGVPMDRTLAGFRHNGALYVASNHWLRGWYHQALENPNVEVTVNGSRRPYTAVSVDGAEREELAAAYSMGFVLRAMCGFAPSRFLRLDPG
jgi:hypothetical protein